MEAPKSSKYTDEQLLSAQYAIYKTPTEAGRTLPEYMSDMRLPSLRQLEGKRILDLGSGLSMLFARHVKEADVKADVHSYSPAYANPLMRKHALLEDDNSEHKVASLAVAGMAEELPYADASFDRVVCMGLVEYLDSEARYHAVLKEIARVLVPGGHADISPLLSTHVMGYPLKLEDSEMQDIVGKDIEIVWQTLPRSNRVFSLQLKKKQHA